MLKDHPNPIPRTWPHWASIMVGILMGAGGTAGLLSLRACREHPNERQQTSPVQGVGPGR